MTGKKGSFVVFDGGEGSGKSSTLRRLKDELGERIMVSREPGGCPRAEKIRTFLLSAEGGALPPEEQFGMFWRARRYHLEDVIIPAIESGVTLICDRFDTSTWSYQVRAANRPDLIPAFWQQRALALDGIEPFYLIFDVSPDVGLARAGKRGDTNRFEELTVAYHRAVRNAMLEFIELPSIDGVLINADRPADDVYRQVHSIVSPLLLEQT
ncbi:MAG TPA: dTMP kinase [Candidatus Paceibacterota bacterium]|nr:dTMP kinase [Candidatus Paceibacterota bacterium]